MPDSPSLAGGRDSTQSIDGVYSVKANQLSLLSLPPLPPVVPDPCVITVLTSGLPELPMSGQVNVRGDQGVRLTAGPPPLPPTDSATPLMASKLWSAKHKTSRFSEGFCRWIRRLR